MLDGGANVDRGVPRDRKIKEFGAGMSALRGSEVPGSLSTAQTSRVVPVNGSSRLLMAFCWIRLRRGFRRTIPGSFHQCKPATS